MIRRLACLLLALLIFCGAAAEDIPGGDTSGTDDVCPPEEYELTGKLRFRYESDTLRFTIESITPGNVHCILTKVWVQDPARQIRKVCAPWGKSLADPMRLMKKLPEAVLGVNASGYITKTYPDLPEGYPGVPADYYFQTLGSVVVTDGEVIRNLEGVPFSGLALTGDGITLYRGADNAEVLATNPIQTWSFYTECPMLLDNLDILPEDWKFADRTAARTIIGRVDRNNYLILTATKQRGKGISLRRAVTFFQENFKTEWVYNLDGGNSTALLARRQGQKKLRLALDRGAKIVDIMAFIE